MARTVGAKGKRRVGSVTVRDDNTLVPINSQRMRGLLVGRPLLPLEACGANRSQLRGCRDGVQGSMRLGKVKKLAILLEVPFGELIAISGAGETGNAYRIDVTARAIAEECWQAAGQGGSPPFWFSDLLRALLNHDIWAGALLDGGTPVLSIEEKLGGRRMAKEVARLEARRRQFCDLMASLIRLLLPTAEDLKVGVGVNPRRAGALLVALRDGFLARLHGVSHPGTAQTRKIAQEAASHVIGRAAKGSRDHTPPVQFPEPKGDPREPRL